MNPLVEKILALRGISDDARDDFLHPTLDKLAQPEELPGIVKAADIVLDSILYRRKIVVFGDYDCDGVCATAIVSRTLRALGGNVSEFIPDRLTEGYGMSEASIARMLKDNPGVGLVVTVDNGINSVAEVTNLKRQWSSVVVTDHHLPGDELPDANAIVDPKLEAPPHLQNLCGAGVAFMLANRVVSEAKRRGMYKGPSIGGPLLVLAGLATVTDIMPLLGQNRILVSEALKRFFTCAPTGLKELHARAARSASAALTTRDFSFMLGPRINAAGRVTDFGAAQALELVVSEDKEIVRELARLVDGYNVERKAIEQRMTDEALAKVVPGAPAQVIDLSDGHPGVAGIVAARVMERLDRDVPVCVYAGGHGSARAPDGFNIRDAFVACDEVLERYGGHAAAGGFSAKEGRIDDFRRMLCEYCEKFAATATSVAERRGEPDLWVEPSDLTLELAEEIRQLEPFGEGNREPVFGLKGVLFADAKPLGMDGKHLSVAFRNSGLRAVWWNHGDLVEKLRAESASPHDVTFTLAVSDYGERHAELRLVSIV